MHDARAFVMTLFTPVTGKLYNKTGTLPLILAGLAIMGSDTYIMNSLTI
ncbi:hypothetical protein JOC94_000504 [Bacillus thermophilus]|uniref:Uncharacterized protein n=1 Tax=Siminovitchia thermophila TaxID=1245522 RepID=A0ABS2R4H7_9BACI|nr:hypothetical protein [Siminovitchia thermophila]MBM7713536.1 hypothetical protein [Siminovitchia thermophila]